MLPSIEPVRRTSSGAILFLKREPDMPHGYFGDRDAGHRPAWRPGGRPAPRACGLFGRLGGDPPLPPVNPRKPLSPAPAPADEAPAPASRPIPRR